MAKLTKAITGVPDGEIYPREIPAGEDCPASLAAYAESLGAFDPLPEGDVTLTLGVNLLESPEFQEAIAEIRREADAVAEQVSAQLDARKAELDVLEAALSQREADLNAREADLTARLAALEAAQAPDGGADQKSQDDGAADKAEASGPKGRAAKSGAAERPA